MSSFSLSYTHKIDDNLVTVRNFTILLFSLSSFSFSHNHSEEEEKGSECIPQFKTMQECFEKFPEVYGKYTDDEADDKGSEEQQKEGGGSDGESVAAEKREGGVSEQTASESKTKDNEAISTSITDAQ